MSTNVAYQTRPEATRETNNRTTASAPRVRAISSQQFLQLQTKTAQHTEPTQGKHARVSDSYALYQPHGTLAGKEFKLTKGERIFAAVGGTVGAIMLLLAPIL